MPYSIELEAQYLTCKTERDARLAAAMISADPWMSPARMTVSARCFNNPPIDSAWRVDVQDFNGFDWDDDHAHPLWIRIAPQMADGATIEFRGEDNERWQIRWEGGRAFEDYDQRVFWAASRPLLAS